MTTFFDVDTFSDVPSEIENASDAGPVGDRRTRKRDARREALLEVAAGVVERHGVEGLTMAALAEAADYAPASLYTYFASRSALLAALQQRALARLGRVADAHVASWRADLAGLDDPRTAALALLWAFSDLFVAAPERFPQEFRLQQELLVSSGAQDTADAASVVPAAMAVLAVPRTLLVEAVAAGALEAAESPLDPLGLPADGELLRTIAWVAALNGVLLADGLVTGLPTTGPALADTVSASLLRGWGADPARSATARALAAELARRAVDPTTEDLS